MISRYIVGPARNYTTLVSSIQPNLATAYLEAQATRYVATSSSFTHPVHIKGLGNNVNQMSTVGDPDFSGMSTLKFGPNFNSIINDPLIFENIYFSVEGSSIIYSNQTHSNRVRLLFNRCLILQESLTVRSFFENIKNTDIEFRNCEFRTKNNGDVFYFFNALPDSNTTINIIKSIINFDILENSLHVGCVRDNGISSNIFGLRDHTKNPKDGYGPNYGTDLITTIPSRFHCEFKSGAQPEISDVSLYDKFGKNLSNTTTSDYRLYPKTGEYPAFAVVFGEENDLVIDDITISTAVNGWS
jgi:hypothetical protein